MGEPDNGTDGFFESDARIGATSDSAETAVGTVGQGPMNVTRPLPPTTAQVRRTAVQASNAATRERIAVLIAALGDTTHPLHHQATNDLVAIGASAVPALNDSLNPQRPWLTAYRAAEVLGQIGDGRAAGPLLEALRHPNSNVRWSAVRALSVVGDARALLELRRVARADHSKTSWGESVSGAAQSMLDQMQSNNLILRGFDLVKTALACVTMIVALILAWSIITNLRLELSHLGRAPVSNDMVLPFQPTAQSIPDSAGVAATSVPTIAPTSAPKVLGTVLATGNVRAQPARTGERVGGINEGDTIVFLAVSPDRQWYRIKLGDRHATSSQIDSIDESGWVSSSLLVPPQDDVVVEQPDTGQPTPTP